MKEIAFSPGQHISSAARELIEAAKANGSATGKFNNIILVAREGTTEADIRADFDRQSEARAEAWRNSPEGQTAAKEREDRRSALQSVADGLMVCLRTLDWKNDAEVLDWCCDIQEPSDYNGVLVRRETIIEIFAKHGYQPNANVGPDYKDGDRENMFRYLVGQALSGLKTGPSIHPIIHKFADDWRARFLRHAA